MKKTLIIFCLMLSMSISGYSVDCFSAPARKPLPPLQISIAPTQSGITSAQIKPSDIVEFKVTAMSFVDVQEIRIDVELLGGAKLVSGNTSWSGPAAKSEEKSITLTVQAPEKGKGWVKARVSLPPSNDTRFSAEMEFKLGPEVKSKPVQEPVIKKDRKGRSIIEYR